MKTLTQERAGFCLEMFRSARDKEKYIRNAKRLPAFIVGNGLIPTLAFYKSKKEAREVYNTLNEWLKHKGFVENDALNELIKADFQKLRLATAEALALAEWLKRIVEVEER